MTELLQQELAGDNAIEVREVPRVSFKGSFKGSFTGLYKC